MMRYIKSSMLVMSTVFLILPLLFMQQSASNAQSKPVAFDGKSILVFLKAAGANDLTALRLGLKRGVPVDSKDQRGRTALLIATYQGAVQAAELLIKAGANVNAKDNLQDSPYLYAGAEGQLEILKMTVAAGADLASVNRYGGTALTPAAHHGYVEVVRYLVATKIDIDQINNLGWTALLEAVILGDGGRNHQAIVKLLLEAGANPTIADREGKPPLQHAKARGQSEILQMLQQAASPGNTNRHQNK